MSNIEIEKPGHGDIDLNYNTLGHFKYHDYEVKLESSQDEREYLITYVSHGETQTEKHTELGSAKDKFEALVDHVMNRTSRSDLSIYMQNV